MNFASMQMDKRQETLLSNAWETHRFKLPAQLHPKDLREQTITSPLQSEVLLAQSQLHSFTSVTANQIMALVFTMMPATSDQCESFKSAPNRIFEQAPGLRG
jgi:hypothetical protein